MFLGSSARSVRRADNLAVIGEPIVYLDNVGSLASHNPIGLHGLLTGMALLFLLLPVIELRLLSP
jgi:hypothetical protein